MRPEERDAAYLWDMLQAALAAKDYISNIAPEAFLAANQQTEVVRLAVERQLEILGEAARRVSLQFREEHPAIPWKEIIGLRNVISHEYHKVNYEAIYRIVCNDLPDLIVTLEPLVPPPPPIEE